MATAVQWSFPQLWVFSGSSIRKYNCNLHFMENSFTVLLHLTWRMSEATFPIKNAAFISLKTNNKSSRQLIHPLLPRFVINFILFILFVSGLCPIVFLHLKPLSWGVIVRRCSFVHKSNSNFEIFWKKQFSTCWNHWHKQILEYCSFATLK